MVEACLVGDSYIDDIDIKYEIHSSHEERIEIVNYCLNRNKNYKKTEERFDTSYTQVYQ